MTRLHSRELAFEILFPTEPAFSIGKKKFLWTCTGAEPDRRQYVVQVARTAKKPSAVLIKRALVPSLAGSYSIKVLKDTTFGEYPCIYFTFGTKNKGDTIRTGRVVWDDHRIFVLEMKGTAEHPAEHWFFNSLVLHPFQLTNPLPKK
ncbi:MAG TPA: hypothetical protein VFV37_01205 [Luteibaculaceae bacterium]|nr:hypothetical protein [Luteibaculaceae bacterium]